MVKLLSLAIALAGAVWVLMRIRQGGGSSEKSAKSKRVKPKRLATPLPAKASSAQPKPGQDWHSVTILSSFGACDAAKLLQDRVFLATDAPSLPLPECDHSSCRCRYEYLDDRRQEDRRSPYGETHGAQIGSNDSNRRKPGNRRKESPEV